MSEPGRNDPCPLALTAVIMLAFTALDVREVVHQVDVNEDGLAVLAAGIAHCTAAPPPLPRQ